MIVEGHNDGDMWGSSVLVYRGDTRWHFESNGCYACVGMDLPPAAAALSPNEVAPDERCQRAGCAEHWPTDHANPGETHSGGTVSDLPRETEEDALLKVVAGLVPATAQQVGAALGKLSIRLQDLTEQLAKADEKATRLTEEYQLAYDMAFLDAGEGKEKVTGAIRESTARVETAQLRLDMEVAKLAVRHLKNAHRTLDRRIDVGRTQAATVRSEHRTIGYGGAA